jgi:pyrophosphatase PpaX
MPRYRTVLFDFDGTLVDSVRLILDSYHHTLSVHGLPPRSDADWLRGLGTPLRAQFAEWATTPDELEGLVATYRDHNLRHHDALVSLYPGVLDMVRAVRAAGLRTGLVTSKNREGTHRGLRVVGLEGTMDVVVSADDVENHKPHPAPVLRALEFLGDQPADVVFVGDSIHDMHSGRAAGVAIAAVLWGPFGREHLQATLPDHWLDYPADLLRLLEIGAMDVRSSNRQSPTTND